MGVIVYLIPISLLLGTLALVGFVWTVRSGQYDDLEGERYRILEHNLKSGSRFSDKLCAITDT